VAPNIFFLISVMFAKGAGSYKHQTSLNFLADENALAYFTPTSATNKNSINNIDTRRNRFESEPRSEESSESMSTG
jgi:hypothetical protein